MLRLPRRSRPRPPRQLFREKAASRSPKRPRLGRTPRCHPIAPPASRRIEPPRRKHLRRRDTAARELPVAIPNTSSEWPARSPDTLYRQVLCLRQPRPDETAAEDGETSSVRKKRWLIVVAVVLASASKRPFFVPDQPASGTVRTRCPEPNSRFSGFGRHSSRSTRMPEEQPFRFVECGDRLLASHGREILEKLVERVASLVVVQSQHRGQVSTPGPHLRSLVAWTDDRRCDPKS